MKSKDVIITPRTGVHPSLRRWGLGKGVRLLLAWLCSSMSEQQQASGGSEA